MLLYTEQTTTRDLVTVPNLIGMTASQANETLSYYGLNYALMGASASSEGALVKSQSVREGTQLQRGSSITLTLSAGEATIKGSAAQVLGGTVRSSYLHTQKG